MHNDQTGDTIRCSCVEGNSKLSGDAVEDIRGFKPRSLVAEVFLDGLVFREAIASLGIILALIALMVMIQIVNVQLDGDLSRYGILPRSTHHLLNIFSAPFVHGSNAHLVSNAFGLLVFGSLVIVRSRWLFIWGSLLIIAVSGVLAWLIGREALHVGASGWIYGLWALTISIAWFDRKLINILVAVVVLLLYGSMSYGLLPIQSSVSFEMHIAGAIAGVVCAYCYQKILNRRRRS